MAESVDEFFNVDDLKDPEISEQATIIHAFVTQPDSVAKSAAQALISLSQAEGGPELSKVVDQIIVPLAEERPETHEDLVRLLGELRDQVEVATGLTPGDSISLNYELWERGLRYGDPDPSIGLRDLYRQEWTNVNRFAALVHKASIEDLSAFGEHTLQLGLRKGGWRVSWSGSENTSDEVDALQGHADAAAQWILVCGERLYNEREDVRKHWSQWEQDLDWITGQDGLKDETKTLCREALAKMKTTRPR
ncbi:hypothetical protein N0V93_002657 [Gnomoniopsis smithogilvyi]|uniref:Uncharacterized protein n=1 Tax=Gnomoniopsis smithogilvyi TaxID=1191159 RepID=A0A9W9CZ67_9PEZI|nr:hypothetical protein N0V93_002657 [Gnomoniopsis smithogilvyi]